MGVGGSGTSGLAAASAAGDSGDAAELAGHCRRRGERGRSRVDELRYLADLPVADVASAMGCALGTVKSTVHAALTRLQIELDELDEIEEVDLDAP
jgi:hypothetical protein